MSIKAKFTWSFMLMVRMNAISFFKTKSKKDLDGFNIYYDKTIKFLRVSLVNELYKSILKYKSDFDKVVIFYRQRDKKLALNEISSLSEHLNAMTNDLNTKLDAFRT